MARFGEDVDAKEAGRKGAAKSLEVRRAKAALPDEERARLEAVKASAEMIKLLINAANGAERFAGLGKDKQVDAAKFVLGVAGLRPYKADAAPRQQEKPAEEPPLV